MRFKRLYLKNIRSYEKQEILFPEGSLLLAGDIGSGKTSVLQAIEYALFGLQPGQKGSSLLRNNAPSGEVMLEMDIDGQNIIIERKLRRGSKSISNDYSAITIDGEKIESSITEVKTKIISLLNYPTEFIKKNNILYRYTVYTPQEQMKQIILEDSETRLNVLRHIFGIDKYKRIRENLMTFLTYLKEESKILQGEIKTIDDEKLRIDSKSSSLSNIGIKIKEKELELTVKIKERKSTELAVQELEKKLEEKQKFEKEVEKTNILLNSKQESLFLLNKESAELIKNISEISNLYNEEDYKFIIEKIKEKDNNIDSLNSKYMSIESQINSLSQLVKEQKLKKEKFLNLKICPTCLQPVSDNHKHSISSDIDNIIINSSRKISSLEENKKELQNLLKKEKDNKDGLNKRKTEFEILKLKIEYIEKAKTKLKESERLKDTLEKDINLLSKHIDSLKEAILKFSTFDNLYRLKQEDLKMAFLAEKNTEISLAEFNKELELTKREISELSELIRKKEKSRTKLSEILGLSDWLSNQFLNLISYIERNIMIKLRLEFSQLFNKWFHILAGENFEVQLDETFTPLILQGEIEMEYSFLSGGERTALALAYRLALNQTVNSILSQIKTRDIVILDEPTEGFSETQIEKMRDVFEELSVEQLILVRHERKIESFIGNIMRIKKQGNNSYLENLL